MRNILKAILVLLIGMNRFQIAKSQEVKNELTKEEIRSLVKKLSWENIGGKCWMLGWKIEPVGDEAEQLIKNAQLAKEGLLEVLTDESRGVIAHIILTKIYYTQYNFGIEVITDKESNKVVGYINNFNGLKWVSFDNGIGFVNKQDLEKIYKQWKEVFSSVE